MFNYKFRQFLSSIVTLGVTAILLSSCANTKLTQSWVEPEHNKSYNDLLVIGIAESQQNRRAYESNFVEELNKIKVESLASYKILKSDQKIERETVLKAIEGQEIDAVLVTHLVAVDEETVYRPPTYAYGGYGGYYGGLYSYYPHVNSYVTSPGYYTTHETYTIETNLYDVKSEELVWTARSQTFSPDSVDEVIVDLTKLLIKDLEEKNLIKVK